MKRSGGVQPFKKERALSGTARAGDRRVQAGRLQGEESEQSSSGPKKSSPSAHRFTRPISRSEALRREKKSGTRISLWVKFCISHPSFPLRSNFSARLQTGMKRRTRRGRPAAPSLRRSEFRPIPPAPVFPVRAAFLIKRPNLTLFLPLPLPAATRFLPARSSPRLPMPA